MRYKYYKPQYNSSAPPLPEYARIDEKIAEKVDVPPFIHFYASIQREASNIDMLSGQYAMASLQRDEVKKKRCADLMVERARALLENAEKLARLER